MSISRRLDEIYNEIDTLLLDGEYAEVDDILSKVSVETEKIEILLGYLSITTQFAEVLLERLPLFNKIEDKAKHEFPPERAEKILRGLKRYQKP